MLERWRQAAAGEGQAVLLVGEAGIGKSRLVRAVLDAARGRAAHDAPLPVLAPPHRHPALAGGPAARRSPPASRPPTPTRRGSTSLRRCCARGQRTSARRRRWSRRCSGSRPAARYPALELTPQQQRARTLAALADAAPRARAAPPGADGARGRALGRPDHAGAGGAGARPDRGRAGADAAHEPARRPALAGRAPARDAAHPQPPRPRPDRGDRRPLGWRAGPAAGGAGARSRRGRTGCRCSSRS